MSSAISSCIDARIEVSGVRSSWLTIEMNCDLSRSSSRASVTSDPMPIRYDVAPDWPRSAMTVQAMVCRAPFLPTQVRSSLTGSAAAASRGMPSRISARSSSRTNGTSQNGRPATSDIETPESSSQARLKRMIWPCESSTMIKLGAVSRIADTKSRSARSSDCALTRSVMSRAIPWKPSTRSPVMIGRTCWPTQISCPSFLRTGNSR